MKGKEVVDRSIGGGAIDDINKTTRVELKLEEESTKVGERSSESNNRSRAFPPG